METQRKRIRRMYYRALRISSRCYIPIEDFYFNGGSLGMWGLPICNQLCLDEEAIFAFFPLSRNPRLEMAWCSDVAFASTPQQREALDLMRAEHAAAMMEKMPKMESEIEEHLDRHCASNIKPDQD